MAVPPHPMEARYDAFIADTLRFARERAAALPPGNSYRFGSIGLTLQVEGDLLKNRLGMAIRHALQANPGNDDIQVIALDGEACGRLPPVWNLPTYDRRHLERLHVSSNGHRFLHHNPDTTNWTLFDRQQKLALTWTARAALLPDWEDSFPLRSIIHWASGLESCCLAHAAVVEVDGKAILLTGRGGSGKSTTTIAALSVGLRTCGDDFVMVDPDTQPPSAHTLYDTIKLDDYSLELFAEFRNAVVNPIRAADQKARIHLSDTLPERLIRSAPLVAIVQPVITHDPSPSLEPASNGSVLRALAPTTMFLLRGEETLLAAKLSSLVRKLPAWQLRLSQDPRASAAFLGEWIRHYPT